MTECKKCGSTNLKVVQDSRGLAGFYCADCGAFIKKGSTAELIEFYDAQLRNPAPDAPAQENKAICKYCTENYFIRQGRLGTTYNPIDIAYCPICGRKRMPGDTDY